MATNDDIEYSLTELCEITRLDAARVRELVGLGVVEPRVDRDYWYFSTRQVSQCARAGRLMRDLELNMHGAALALDLMDRNRRLRRRVAYLEQLLKRIED